MDIFSNFEGGKINVISCVTPDDIRLEIANDDNAPFRQWFYFGVHGAKDKLCKLKFINASKTTYPSAWDKYQLLYSYNKKDWYRTHTCFDGQQLIAQLTPKHDTFYCAFFVPYSYEQHLSLISRAQISPICSHQVLGFTAHHRPIDLLVIGEPKPSRKKIWIIARQHSAETMAEWYCEGLIERLLNSNDTLSKDILKQCTFYLVPNMNPDGTVLGNLRANGTGTDMNRSWKEPNVTTEPEAFYVKQKILNTGCDFFLDVHGDEERPYVYLFGRKDTPKFSEKIEQLELKFKTHYHATNPDFQFEFGYPIETFGNGVLMSLASPNIGDYFDCLSFTIELPFIDNEKIPDKELGFGTMRCKKLGADFIVPLREILML